MQRLGKLTQPQLDNVLAPLGQAQTLPPAAYQDPAVFQQECAQIFYKEWICVARVEQLPNSGDYLCVEVIQQPLLLVRLATGELHAMSSICLHRGMPIATESGTAQSFQCPYHLWRYDLSGKLMNAPLMEQTALPKNCQLPPVQVETWHGFVFVNLDPNAASLNLRLPQLNELLLPYHLNDMVWANSTTWDCPWNWKILVENFMEAYHHLGPHSQSVQPTNPARDSYVSGNLEQGWSLLHMPPKSTDADPSATSSAETLAGLIMPSFCWLNLPDHAGAFWYQLLPRQHDQMTLILHTLIPKTVAQSSAGQATADALQAVIDEIHREDLMVNQGPWVGLQAPLTQQGLLSQWEKAIWLLNHWWAGRIWQNS